MPEPDVSSSPAARATGRCSTDEGVLDWVRAAHETTDLDDLRLHRLAGARRRRRPRGHAGDEPLGVPRPLRGARRRAGAERVVEDGKVITAAGVSAGIDMALHLVARERRRDVAKAIQLGIEYDPEPPVRRRLAREGRRPELVELIRCARGRRRDQPCKPADRASEVRGTGSRQA